MLLATEVYQTNLSGSMYKLPRRTFADDYFAKYSAFVFQARSNPNFSWYVTATSARCHKNLLHLLCTYIDEYYQIGESPETALIHSSVLPCIQVLLLKSDYKVELHPNSVMSNIESRN